MVTARSPVKPSLTVDGPTVSLPEVLTARERRVEKQEAFLLKYDSCVISFTLNIPGRIKNCQLFGMLFDEGLRKLYSTLSENNIKIHCVEIEDAKTGLEAILAVTGAPGMIKCLTAGVEETHPLGRLYDMDVIAQSRIKVSRAAVGFAARKCLICHESVYGCARSRKHAENELLERITSMLGAYFGL